MVRVSATDGTFVKQQPQEEAIEVVKRGDDTISTYYGEEDSAISFLDIRDYGSISNSSSSEDV